MSGQTSTALAHVRDLIDFVRHWDTYRDVAQTASGSSALTTEQKAVIDWLIMLADRVGPRDAE